MPEEVSSSVCIHLITEGPTDRILLTQLIRIMIRERSIRFLKISSTQRTRTGKNSIIHNSSILSKFLHHGFHKNVDIIVICVDNDEAPEFDGIGVEMKRVIQETYAGFCEDNNYYSKIPCLVSAIPIKTLDYWMKVILERTNDCRKIVRVMTIAKGSIKEETYGEKCVFRGQFIDDKAIKEMVDLIEPTSLKKLRCLPSFNDFEEQLSACLSKN